MKSKLEIKTLFLVAMITILVTSCWITEPQRNEPRYKVVNSTIFSLVHNDFNNGIHIGEVEMDPGEYGEEDGGGQLTVDSVMFVRGANIENGQLKNPIDSVFYINPRHLTDQAYELVKGRSFFNIENWIPEGKDFVYSVYDSDFE